MVALFLSPLSPLSITRSLTHKHTHVHRRLGQPLFLSSLSLYFPSPLSLFPLSSLLSLSLSSLSLSLSLSSLSLSLSLSLALPTSRDQGW